MGNTESSFLKMYTVNMGTRRPKQSESSKGWTSFRREYINNILEKGDLDVVFVQEGISNLLNEENRKKYKIFQSGSVGIIIKNYITCNPIKTDILPESTRERIVAITIEYQDISFCFASFHGENVIGKRGKKSEEKRIWDNFRDLIWALDKLRKEFLCPIVVGGDFNLDVDLVRKAVEGIKNSSLLVVSTESAVEAVDYDYDFFIISYDWQFHCRKERQNRFFPKKNPLSQLTKPIIDHSPTGIIVKLSEKFEKVSTETIIDRLEMEVDALKSKMKRVLDKRIELCRFSLSGFLKEYPPDKFELVDVYHEKFIEIPDSKKKDGLIGYRRILFLIMEVKTYEQNIKTLKGLPLNFEITPLESGK